MGSEIEALKLQLGALQADFDNYVKPEYCSYCGDKESNSYIRVGNKVYCGRHHSQLKTRGVLTPLTQRDRDTINKPRSKNVLYLGRDPDDRSVKHVTYDVTEEGCWNINSHHLDKDGYGCLRRVVNGVTHRRAHRVVYAFEVRAIEDGMLILHNCHNPSCINPEHLREGTHEDNMQDRLEVGNYYGENHGTAKLNKELVLEIDTLLKNGKTNMEISLLLNVNKYTVADIKRGRTWAHTT